MVRRKVVSALPLVEATGTCAGDDASFLTAFLAGEAAAGSCARSLPFLDGPAAAGRDAGDQGAGEGATKATLPFASSPTRKDASESALVRDARGVPSGVPVLANPDELCGLEDDPAKRSSPSDSSIRRRKSALMRPFRVERVEGDGDADRAR